MRSTLAALLLLTALPAGALAQSLVAQDASVRDIEFVASERSFEFADADGTRSASAWRVVEQTGNGNE